MASYFGEDNAPLGGVAGSPREWVLVPAYSERPWKSPEKGAHPLRQRRLGGTTEVARELQFHVNNLTPLVAVLPTPKELNAGI